MDALVFYISGILMIASALLVVTRKNPVYSAILLVIFFVLTSVNFLVLRSPFLAVIQVLVYGGAIMVLFIFVLMLLNLTPQELEEKTDPRRKALAAAGSACLFGLLCWAISSSKRIGEGRRSRSHGGGHGGCCHRRRDPGDRQGAVLRTYPAV